RCKSTRYQIGTRCTALRRRTPCPEFKPEIPCPAVINVRLAVRPVRVGFVIKHGDFDALWRAIRFNTCLWGGYFNPIVPVRAADLLPNEERAFDDPSHADYLVRAFEADLLEQLSDDENCKAFIEARGHLRRPHGPGLVYDEGTPNRRLSLLDVQPVLRG